VPPHLHAELTAAHSLSSSVGRRRATPAIAAIAVGRATLSSSSAGRRRAVVRAGAQATHSGRLARWVAARSGGGPRA
jgi:hypothetical protein